MLEKKSINNSFFNEQMQFTKIASKQLSVNVDNCINEYCYESVKTGILGGNKVFKKLEALIASYF